MYGKIFESIYDGTLSDNWQALITFQQMIVLCDADGIIDMTPQAISRRTGIPVEHIVDGISFLEKEDEYSRTPDENGKRIVRLDEHRPWGWSIVNHSKYKSLQDSDTVRHQNKIRKQKQRARHEESRIVTDCHGQSRHTDTNTDTKTTNTSIDVHVELDEKQERPFTDDFLEFWKHYPNKKGKGSAYRAWKKIKRPKETLALIQTALIWQKNSEQWLKNNGQFIPHPATYLNGRRWEDEREGRGNAPVVIPEPYVKRYADD